MVGSAWLSAATLVVLISCESTLASLHHTRLDRRSLDRRSLDRRSLLEPLIPPVKTAKPAVGQDSIKAIKEEIKQLRNERETHERNVREAEESKNIAHEGFMSSMFGPAPLDAEAAEQHTIGFHGRLTEAEKVLEGHQKALEGAKQRKKELKSKMRAHRKKQIQHFVGLGKKEDPKEMEEKWHQSPRKKGE